MSRFQHDLRMGARGIFSVALGLLVASCQTPASLPGTNADRRGTLLFDGKSLAGWKDCEFGGHAGAEVKAGKIILAMGEQLTGLRWEGKVPHSNYEVSLDAMRVEGSDFFCGLTFPVGNACCTFVVGGWGGGVVGISSIDDNDASENETTKYKSFEKGRWYRVRVRVTDQKIEAWIDAEKIVDVVITGRKISMRRGEIEAMQPFGVATWRTQAALRDIRMRELNSESSAPSK